MDDIKDERGEDDWQSVEGVEESLVGDDTAIPTVIEFDGTVDSTEERTVSDPDNSTTVLKKNIPNKEEDGIQDKSRQHNLNVTGDNETAGLFVETFF